MARVWVLLVVFMLPGFVRAAPILFGQFNAHYEFIDTEKGNEYRLNDVGSRIGVKGAGIIDEQREYTYLFEGASDLAGESEVLNEVRQAWVGIRTSDYEMRIGRHLSPARVAVVPVDLFADQGAAQTKVLEGDIITSKSMVYLGRLNEFAYALAFSLDSSNTHSALDMLINYNNENTYIAAAYLKGYDQQRVSRLAATYRFPAGYKVGAAFEYLNDTGDGDDHRAYVINAGYPLDQQKLLKAQWGANRSSAGGKTETLLGVGMDYALTEATVLKFQYSVNRHTDHQDADERTLSVGVTHQF
jgi:opacity protein-like surface antigen